MSTSFSSPEQKIFYSLLLFPQAGGHELKLYIIVHLSVFKIAIFKFVRTYNSQNKVSRTPIWCLYHTKRLPFSAIYLATDCATWQDTDRFPSPAIINMFSHLLFLRIPFYRMADGLSRADANIFPFCVIHL